MNNRELIKELLKLSDEALKEIGRGRLVDYRSVAEEYINGSEVQIRLPNCASWNSLEDPDFSATYSTYRIKPRTININGHEVPEPIRNPNHGDRVFYYDGLNAKPIYRGYDDVRISHIQLRNRGVIFGSEEDCQKYIDAILSFTKEKS